MCLLGKKYPLSEREFAVSGLYGKFDPGIHSCWVVYFPLPVFVYVSSSSHFSILTL
jgi:hypothetical protein